MGIPAGKGIYQLGKSSLNGDPFGKLSEINKPFIHGRACRLHWKFLTPAGINKLVDALNQAHGFGKKLGLLIRCTEIPDDVLAVAVEKYQTVFEDGRTITTCKPWDEPSMQRWEAFCYKLGLRIGAHPAVGPIRFSGLGVKHVARRHSNDQKLELIPDWDRQKYIGAEIRSIRAIANAFPNTPVHCGYFDTKDGMDPDIDTVMLPALVGALPGLGGFMEAWKGGQPDGKVLANLRRFKSLGSYLGFQAVGSWRTHNPGEWKSDSGKSPMDGYAYLKTVFGSDLRPYLEIYSPDLENTAWQAGLQKMHDELN